MITTSYRPSEHTIKTAKQLSKELNMPYCGRNKQTVEHLLKSAERDLLVVGKERFELYTKQGLKILFSSEYSDVQSQTLFTGRARAYASGCRLI